VEASFGGLQGQAGLCAFPIGQGKDQTALPVNSGSIGQDLS